jgi:hypothetical protein
LKKYKSPGRDEILKKLTQAGGETLLSVIHNLINFIRNKEGLPDQWSIALTKWDDDNTDCNK